MSTKNFKIKGINAIIVLVLLLTMSLSMNVSAATTVGEFTVYSYTGSDDSSSSNTSGHSFLSFKNTTDEAITIGKLSVQPGHEITFGTWGNKDAHEGIWFNLESYFVNVSGAYEGRVSLTMDVDSDDVTTINDFIDDEDDWSLTNNCSNFAQDLWNDISSDDLSNSWIPTPTKLANSIKGYSYYETDRDIANTRPVGYISGSSFVTVEEYSSYRMIQSYDYEPVVNGTEVEVIYTNLNDPCSFPTE